MEFYYIYNEEKGEWRRYNDYNDAETMLVSLGNPWEGVYNANELQARMNERKQSAGGVVDRILRNAGSGRTGTRYYSPGVYRR